MTIKPLSTLLLATLAVLALAYVARALDCEVVPGTSCTTDAECVCMHGE